MRLKLTELQIDNQQAKKIRSESTRKEGWEEVNEVLHFQGLTYVSEIICIELISRHHDDSLADNFEIEKTRELITRKYYWLTLHHNVEAYVKSCDVCLASKAVRHKPYGDL